MEVGVNSAEFDTKNGWEVEIESTKWRKHGTTCKHDVEMTYYVKGVMKEDIHTGMRDAHSTDSTWNKKKNKSECEE